MYCYLCRHNCLCVLSISNKFFTNFLYLPSGLISYLFSIISKSIFVCLYQSLLCSFFVFLSDHFVSLHVSCEISLSMLYSSFFRRLFPSLSTFLSVSSSSVFDLVNPSHYFTSLRNRISIFSFTRTIIFGKIKTRTAYPVENENKTNQIKDLNENSQTPFSKKPIFSSVKLITGAVLYIQ